MTNEVPWMAVDEFPTFDESHLTSPAPRKRRHARGQRDWSPDQLLDPLVLAATAPMALFPERFPREAYFIAAALIVVPYVVRKSNSGRYCAPTPIIWPILILGIVILPISVWVTPAFWSVSWGEFVRFVWGMAVLLGVTNWCAAGSLRLHSDGRISSLNMQINLATAAWFALGAAFTTVGMLALRSTSKAPLLGDIMGLLPDAAWLPESIAQGFNANRVAGLAVLFLPFALALFLSPVGRQRTTLSTILWRMLMLATALFFGGALLLTQSRAALLAGVLAVIFVSVLAGRRGLIPLALIAVVIIAALDVFGGAGIVDTFSVGGGESASGSTWQRIVGDRNVAGRIVIWQRALHGISDEPLTGMGLAGFEQRSQELYTPMPEWLPDTDIVHAHNLLLQTALDLGIPGMLMLLTIIGIAGWEVYNSFSSSRSRTPARFWAIGTAGALAAFVLYNLLDAVSVGARPAVSYWFLLGLIAGVGAALRKTSQHREHAVDEVINAGFPG